MLLTVLNLFRVSIYSSLFEFSHGKLRLTGVFHWILYKIKITDVSIPIPIRFYIIIAQS
jgi:hypothetical protein